MKITTILIHKHSLLYMVTLVLILQPRQHSPALSGHQKFHTGSLWNSGWTSRSPSSPTSEFPQTSSRTLQSGTVNLLKVHRAKLHSRGDGAAPRLWNPLPEHLRSTTEDLRPLSLLLVSSPRYVHRSFHAFLAALSDVFNVKCNINHIHSLLILQMLGDAVLSGMKLVQ